MKKFLMFIALLFTMFSCSDENKYVADEAIKEHAIVHRCFSHEVLQEEIAHDPKRAQRLEEIERFTHKALSSGVRTLLPDGTMEIPVIFNVIYRTAAENISDAQLDSQIDVLNEDFGATNADYNLTAFFNSVKSGNTGIKFKKVATNRKYSSKNSWRTNNDMKFASKGGIDATTPTTHLNIWIVNKMTSGGSTILGYAQFPGGAVATDGVVLGHNFTGRTGVVSAPYNKGRTATHEVGHWLNLRHIWGDATCGNDQVSDTPLHNSSNSGCPTQPHLSTCSGTPQEMTMNYMDYTNDNCMYMFTAGQKSRMSAVFAVGGPRAGLR